MLQRSSMAKEKKSKIGHHPKPSPSHPRPHPAILARPFIPKPHQWYDKEPKRPPNRIVFAGTQSRESSKTRSTFILKHPYRRYEEAPCLPRNFQQTCDLNFQDCFATRRGLPAQTSLPLPMRQGYESAPRRCWRVRGGHSGALALPRPNLLGPWRPIHKCPSHAWTPWSRGPRRSCPGPRLVVPNLLTRPVSIKSSRQRTRCCWTMAGY